MCCRKFGEDNTQTWGAANPPILAIIEHMPTAVLRIWVGYNSAVYKYTIAKEADAPNFPIRANAVLGVPSSINPAGIAAIPDRSNELRSKKYIGIEIICKSIVVKVLKSFIPDK